jgi:D-serine deaminase-like pyridoxal phosphate-dependent protein
VLSKSQIPTPALLLDLDAFEANVAQMADRVKQSGKQLRPHAKAHKCVEIAQRQIAAGACGVCVATVPEAEMMTQAGITGLLLTSPLADPRKMARAVATGAMVVVDHLDQAVWYNAVARATDRTADVLVDLDVGDHRTGARSTEQALEIAKAVADSSHLRFRGLQGYSVSGSHAGGFEGRKRVSEAAFAQAITTRAALGRAGLACEILTGGSTGTWDIDTELAEVTELQAGSYVLMDLAYRKEGLPFRHALTVLTTVVSANHQGFVTVDGGYKSFSADRGYGPEALSLPGSGYRWGGDEFGYLDSSPRARLGERIEFVPPHCDPTVNLHERIYACRGEKVEAVWSVMNRYRAASSRDF